MSHVERCVKCPRALVPRVHPLGIGQVFLECPDCGYTEDVRRQPDPKPTPTRKKVLADGTVVIRQRKEARHVERVRRMSAVELSEIRAEAGRKGGLAKHHGKKGGKVTQAKRRSRAYWATRGAA